jgi:hypothetical protein
METETNIVENTLAAIEEIIDIEFDMSPDESYERKSYYGEGTLFGADIGVSVIFEDNNIKQLIIESVPGGNSYGIGYVSVIKDGHEIFDLSRSIPLAIDGIIKMRKLLRYISEEDKQFIRDNEGILTIIGKTYTNEYKQIVSQLDIMELCFEYIPLCISSYDGILLEYAFDVRATKDYSIVKAGLTIDQAIKYVRENSSK